MEIDKQGFAVECVRWALLLGVNPHYLLAAAQLRSGIQDQVRNDRIGPFQISQPEWDAVRRLLLPFEPRDIHSLSAQSAWAAITARDAHHSLLQRGFSPSVFQLYLDQWKEDESRETLVADLQHALDATAALVGPALAELADVESPSPRNTKDAIVHSVHQPLKLFQPNRKFDILDRLAAIGRRVEDLGAAELGRTPERGRTMNLSGPQAEKIREIVIAQFGGDATAFGDFAQFVFNTIGIDPIVSGWTPANLTFPTLVSNVLRRMSDENLTVFLRALKGIAEANGVSTNAQTISSIEEELQQSGDDRSERRRDVVLGSLNFGDKQTGLESMTPEESSPTADDAVAEEKGAAGEAAAPEQSRKYLAVDWSERTVRQTRPLALAEGLQVGRSYVLSVGLSDLPDPRYGGTGAPPAVERQAPENLQIRVVAISQSDHVSVVEKQLGEFVWPKSGPVTERARFLLAANRAGDATIDILLYYELNVIYMARFSATVVEQGHAWPPDGRPIRWLHRTDEDSARSQLFRDFAQISGLPGKAASIVVQRAREDAFVLTFLIGRAELPIRVHMTTAELADRLTKVRSLLDRLRREPFLVEGGFTQNGLYEGGADSAHLFDQAGQHLDAVAAGAVQSTFFKEMATFGARLRDDLFASTDGKIAYAAITKWLRPDAVVQVWIDRDASEFLFPWVWIYDGGAQPGMRINADWRQFWGAKYVIEQLPQFADRLVLADPVPEIAGPSPLKLVVGPFTFTQTKSHLGFFQQCSNESGGRLTFETWPTPDEWTRGLSPCDRQIIYFFSHGHVAKPSAVGISFYDMLQACRDWAAQAPPCETAAMRKYRLRFVEYLDSLKTDHAPLDQTFIRLDDGYLLASMLKSIKIDRCQPFVFLNMCESAQVFPSLSDGLIEIFMRGGSRGVIGTEMPMIPQFGEHFARLFFERFFYGQDGDARSGSPCVGRILLDLRRTFIEAGNPLAFAYTHFGDASVRLDGPLPRHAATQGGPGVAGSEMT